MRWAVLVWSATAWPFILYYVLGSVSLECHSLTFYCYVCTRALHSFLSFAHCRAASTIIPLLPKPTFTPSIQPNLCLPSHIRPPLTSAINPLLAIRYSSILSACPNHLYTLWYTLLANSLSIPALLRTSSLLPISIIYCSAHFSALPMLYTPHSFCVPHPFHMLHQFIHPFHSFDPHFHVKSTEHLIALLLPTFTFNFPLSHTPPSSLTSLLPGICPYLLVLMSTDELTHLGRSL